MWKHLCNQRSQNIQSWKGPTRIKSNSEVNGPYRDQKDELSVNPFSWNQANSPDLPYYTFFFFFLEFGLSRGVGLGFFLFVFIFANYCTLKTKPTKPLPPVSFGKEPCAGKLDLSKAAFCTDQSHMVMDVSYHVQIMSCI